MDKTELEKTLAAAGFANLTPYLDKLARRSIRLQTAVSDESALKIGTSKLGGSPDLPPGITWPQWQGIAQSFIAQIQLADVQQYNSDHLLPVSGMLWFFYNAQQQTYGDKPQDSGSWSVLYKDSALSTLQRTPFPQDLPAESQFKPCSLTFFAELTLSAQPQLEIPTLTWGDADQQKYDSIFSAFQDQAGRTETHNRMLGYPDTIQDDMRLQCQLTVNGITDIKDPRVPALTKNANDWQLLFQVDSDDQAKMRWANSGMLYYWLKVADLQARQFDKSWLVLQSE